MLPIALEPRYRGIIDRPSLLPKDASVGDEYIANGDLYIFEGFTWRRLTENNPYNSVDAKKTNLMKKKKWYLLRALEEGLTDEIAGEIDELTVQLGE